MTGVLQHKFGWLVDHALPTTYIKLISSVWNLPSYSQAKSSLTGWTVQASCLDSPFFYSVYVSRAGYWFYPDPWQNKVNYWGRWWMVVLQEYALASYNAVQLYVGPSGLISITDHFSKMQAVYDYCFHCKQRIGADKSIKILRSTVSLSSRVCRPNIIISRLTSSFRPTKYVKQA